MSEDEKIIEKIKKLMSLAGSSNEAEARLAAQKAQDLMMRHNIDLSKVRTKVSDYTFGQVKAVRVSRELSLINSLLKEFFFVHPVIDRRDGTIKYVGLPSNIEVALYVQGFLLTTFKRLWASHLKENYRPSRISFMHGLYDGLRGKLRENKEAYEKAYEEQRRAANNDPGKESESLTALVEASNSMMKSYIANELGKVTKKTVGSFSVDDDYYQGKEQGRNINISPGLSSRSDAAPLALGYK